MERFSGARGSVQLVGTPERIADELELWLKTKAADGFIIQPSVLLPDGRRVFFKQIRRVRLPQTCAGCRFNNNDTDCEEGFYGVRLYRDRDGTHQVGVWIQRMDLARPLDDFLASDLPEEIRRLRASEHVRLTDEVGRRADSGYYDKE